MTNNADVPVAETSAQPRTASPAEMRRILASSFMGSAIEYYDFLLYAMAAALVFGPLFFAGSSPGVATFASFGTLAVGYFARPLGGVIFGHFGDLVGRKTVLVISMLMMGVGTVAIGLLPGSAQIGMLAPILLVVLRIVQGLALGGEWGGAVLMALEHAPDRKRGFAASFANMGGPVGVLSATLLFSAMTLLPRAQFLAWGWRIPFLLSALLIAVGLVIRLKVSESPLFQELEAKVEQRKTPVVELFVHSPRALLLGFLAAMSIFTLSGMVTVWAVSFAVQNGANQTGVLNAKAIGAVGALLTIILGARLSDRFGRRPVLLAGVGAAGLSALPIVWLTSTGTVVGYGAAVILGQLCQGLIIGPFGAYVAELFPTRLRYTGASVAYQGAGAIAGGLTPMAATGVLLLTGGNILVLGIAWMATLLISGLAVLLSREGRDKDLRRI